MTIIDRYSSAVRSHDLSVKTGTTFSDSDVLGAVGLAGKEQPLPMALARLFAGDNHAVREIVELLTSMLVGKAWHGQREELPRTEAADIARAVLAWHREGVCRGCGGHGYKLIEGAPSVGDKPCGECHGTRRRPFDREFSRDHLWLAQWLAAEVDRATSWAGPAAMRALAPRLEI